jgi:hypothetical protein
MADGAYRSERDTLLAKIDELQREVETLRAKTTRPIPARPIGPAKNCRACGQNQMVVERYSHDNSPRKYAPALKDPMACTPANRVGYGWFRRCGEAGEHLHEECRICGARWLSAFANEGSR